MYQILLPSETDVDEALRTAEHVASLAIPDAEFTMSLLNKLRKFDSVEGDARVSSTEVFGESAFPESVVAIREYL